MTYFAYLYGAHWYEALIRQGKVKNFGPAIFQECFGLSPDDNPALYEDQKGVFDNVRCNLAMLETLAKSPRISLADAAGKLGMSAASAQDSYANIRRLLERGGPFPEDRPLYLLPPVIVDGKTLSFDDLRGGVFFYGLTATGTHDLNRMFSTRL
jgi:hypothetical protein